MAKIFYLPDICSLPMESPKKKKVSWKKLKNRYRLVVMNDDTFEEKLSLRLTPLGLFVLVGTISLIMTTLVISLVAFTPLREYIPGYSMEPEIKKRLIGLSEKSDSLENALFLKTQYLENIRLVLSGEIKADTLLNPKDTSLKYKNLKLTPSHEDSILRKEVERQDKFSVKVGMDQKLKNSMAGFFFFSPVKGVISSSFNAAENHFGIDIVTAENEAIKSTLDGTIIYSGWSSESGNVIQIQHSNNLVSVYKHASRLLKKVGQHVKAGEVVGLVGSSGELSTGPHLHFEIWFNGNPLNPSDLIVF